MCTQGVHINCICTIVSYVVRLKEFVKRMKICCVAEARAGRAAPSPQPAPSTHLDGSTLGGLSVLSQPSCPHRGVGVERVGSQVGEDGRCWRAVEITRCTLCPYPWYLGQRIPDTKLLLQWWFLFWASLGLKSPIWEGPRLCSTPYCLEIVPQSLNRLS